MQKKDGFISIVKGTLTGIASLIPGISPASCIISLSSYDDFIKGISSIFKRKNKEKNQTKQILLLLAIPIIIGIILGLAIGNHLVNYFLNKYQVQTIFLFIGLLTGGIILIFKKKKPQITKSNITTFIISIILVFTIYFLLSNNTNTIPKSIIPLVGGILTTLTILIPSISLSYVSGLLDKYNLITSSLSLSSIKDVLVVLIFIITLIISFIMISKLIYYLLKNYKQKLYIIISTLLILNIVILISKINSFTISFVNIFTTILAFLWGYLLAKNIEKE